MPKYGRGYMSPPYMKCCHVNNIYKIHGGLFVYVIYYPYLCIVGNRVEDYGRGIHYLKESEVARPHHSKGSYNI